MVMFNEFKKIFQRPFKLAEQQMIIADNQYQIRTAKLMDLARLYELQRAVFAGEEPWTKQTYIAELTNRRSLYLVVEIHDEIVGFAGISKRNRHEVHITNIGIDPDFQHQGLGCFVLDKFFKMARDGDYQKITLEVDINNQHAIDLYKALDFYEVKLERNYYDNGNDALTLCKQINK